MYKIGRNYWKTDNFFVVEEKNWGKFDKQNQFNRLESDDIPTRI